MNCIIVDDEPVARKGMKSLVEQIPQLTLVGSFNNAIAASAYINEYTVDLIFLDIQMPGITGIEFAQSIPVNTLIVFTTAYAEYALDSYEVSAIDYLVKPIEMNRFLKAVNKAIAYHKLLLSETAERVEEIQEEYIFIKSERRYIKINFSDILFIEGLKDYSILQLEGQRVITKMNLKNILPEIDTDKVVLSHPDVNRPALQLAGFFDHFDRERVQIIGFVEQEYIKTLPRERKVAMYERLLSSEIPCVLYSRSQMPDEDMKDLCLHYQVPCLVSDKSTSDLMAEVIRWLKVKMAPCISIHGVLVDVFGEGVLIMGESGIGKSEAALELIKRGHRLVTDDVVEIRKVSDETQIGSAPEITRHFIELRGIGIIDVKTLFGVESVKDTQSIDMVIKLEEWDKDKEYDRLGMEDQYTEFLGNKIVCHSIPIRPGRNLAIIVESAAVNYRTKKMGYNAAKELYKRVQANLARRD